MQIRNNTLADEVGSPDDMENLVVVVTNKGELEPVFGGINGDGLGPCAAIEAVDRLALDASEIHRLLEGTDDTIVAV